MSASRHDRVLEELERCARALRELATEPEPAGDDAASFAEAIPALVPRDAKVSSIRASSGVLRMAMASIFGRRSTNVAKGLAAAWRVDARPLWTSHMASRSLSSN